MINRQGKQTILLTVAYDGSTYAGFTVQDGQRTVGGELLTALRHFDPHIDRLRVASRTDARVHADGQRVAFDTEHAMPTRAWVLGVNRHLPATISIQSASVAPDAFNPRYETVLKSYRYRLLCRRLPDPFWAGRAWRVGGMADEQAQGRIRTELLSALGTHRFDAYRSARDRRMHTERTIVHAAVTCPSSSPDLVALDVIGDGFLHNMVRILVGTAVDVGRARLAPGAVRRALRSGNRADAGVTAPPDGLVLRWVRLRRYGVDDWPPGSGGPEGDWPPGGQSD